MRLYVLASGSKGNLSVLESNQKHYMIDCGLPITKMKKKLMDANIDIESIDTLFLTHEHSDHVLGLKSLLKLKTLKHIYLTQGTFNALKDTFKEDLALHFHIIKQDESFTLLSLEITPIMLSHDASEPVGFVFKKEDKKFVLLTDTGYVNDEDLPRLSGANLYMLEANHDPNMLMSSKRPFMLKKRIIGPLGHLSNMDACMALNLMIKDIVKTTWVVSHISEDCNSILSIEKDIVRYIDDPTKIDVHYSSQNSLEVYDI